MPETSVSKGEIPASVVPDDYKEIDDRTVRLFSLAITYPGEIDEFDLKIAIHGYQQLRQISPNPDPSRIVQIGFYPNDNGCLISAIGKRTEKGYVIAAIGRNMDAVRDALSGFLNYSAPFWKFSGMIH